MAKIDLTSPEWCELLIIQPFYLSVLFGNVVCLQLHDTGIRFINADMHRAALGAERHPGHAVG